VFGQETSVYPVVACVWCFGLSCSCFGFVCCVHGSGFVVSVVVSFGCEEQSLALVSSSSVTCVGRLVTETTKHTQ